MPRPDRPGTARYSDPGTTSLPAIARAVQRFQVTYSYLRSLVASGCRDHVPAAIARTRCCRQRGPHSIAVDRVEPNSLPQFQQCHRYWIFKARFMGVLPCSLSQISPVG